MRTTPLLTILLACILAFAGCITDPSVDPDVNQQNQDRDDGIDPAPSDDDAASPPATDDPDPDPAGPDLSIAASQVNGTAPLIVLFNLSSTDRDASGMDWSLDATGDGATDESGYGLPSEVSFTYDAAGTFNATFYATDLDGMTANKTLSIQVDAPPVVQVPDPVRINGTITGVGYEPAFNTHGFDLNTSVNRMVLAFEVGDTAFDLDYVVYDPAGNEVQRTATENEPSGLLLPVSDPPIVIDDPTTLSELGGWRVVVQPWLAIEGEYTITITFE